jgi:hypothetical protein
MRRGVLYWGIEGKTMEAMDIYHAKTLKLLERNHVQLKDIARYAGTTIAKARRIIDTLSLDYPIYEVRRGVYGKLPPNLGKRRPRGFLAKARAAAGLSPSGY